MNAALTGRITPFSTVRNRVAICSNEGALSRIMSRSFRRLGPISSFMPWTARLVRVLS